MPKPTAQFPNAIAGDLALAIATNRLQTTLTVALTINATTMTVASAASIVAYSLLSIDNEIVRVTAAPTGNVVPIERAFDSTTAAVHSIGATVAGFVDAYHHNTLVSEVEAIETAAGVRFENLQPFRATAY